MHPTSLGVQADETGECYLGRDFTLKVDRAEMPSPSILRSQKSNLLLLLPVTNTKPITLSQEAGRHQGRYNCEVKEPGDKDEYDLTW